MSEVPISEIERQGQSATPLVLIPTTAGPVEIKRLKPRPRLFASVMVLENDFRAMPNSSAYDEFVKGPLKAILPEAGHFELSLSDGIDNGRSWELPVLVSHLLSATSKPSTYRLIWATGLVNTDLSPQSSQYHFREKIAHSDKFLSRFKVEDGKALVLTPPVEDSQDLQALEQFAEIHGMRFQQVSSLGEVIDALGIGEDLPPLHQTTDLAQVQENAPASITVSQQPVDIGKKTAIASKYLFLSGAFASGCFILLAWGLWPTNIQSGKTMELQGLYAQSQPDCVSRIFKATQPLIVASLNEEDGKALCGVRVRNLATSAKTMASTPELLRATLNPPSYSNGKLIPAGEHLDIYFRKLPSEQASSITLQCKNGSETAVIDWDKFGGANS